MRLAAALIALVLGCTPRAASNGRPGDPEPALREVWVDASAPIGGTGAADLPWRDLKSALAPSTLIHLATGIYPGPVVLPSGAVLISQGGLAVISLQGPGTVISATAGRLEGLSIQGGEFGLRVQGKLSLSGVRLSGQSKAGLVVESTGDLLGERLEVVGVIPEVDGVVAHPGAAVHLRGARFSGGLRRAVDAVDAEVTLEAAASAGVKELLHLVGGRGQVLDCTASAGSGPAVFAARATLRVDGLKVQGHEYGLMAGNGAQLDARHLDLRAPQLAALAGVKAKVVVRDARLEGGSYAAVQLLESDSLFTDVQVEGARAAGLVVRLGTATFERLSVRDVAADTDGGGETGGDGLHLRGATVTATDVVVQRAQGAAVFATSRAVVKLTGLGADSCDGGGIVVELGSRVEAKGVVVKNPVRPPLAVPDASFLSVEDLVLYGAELPIWAECSAGAKAMISGMRGGETWRPPACVTVRGR